MDFTVAICTYNGDKRLPQVLDCLKLQSDTEFAWEVLVIDNNSTDDTANVVATYQSSWNSTTPLRYFFEPEQGAAFARQRAIKEALAPLVGFLDDDNLPDPNWVAAAYSFGREHPLAGAYGSRISGEFAGETPPNFERIQPFFALTERGAQPRRYNSWKKVLPPGAGLVVRKQAWTSVPQQCRLRGRIPGSMLTGEDLEVVSYFQKAGWEIWYNPEMQLKHLIPGHRLEKEYLIPFFRGIGLSRHATRMIQVQWWAKPFMLVAYLINDLRKIVWHLLKHGRQVKSDLVTACELELYINSLKSPFFLGINQYLNFLLPKRPKPTTD